MVAQEGDEVRDAQTREVLLDRRLGVAACHLGKVGLDRLHGCHCDEVSEVVVAEEHHVGEHRSDGAHHQTGRLVTLLIGVEPVGEHASRREPVAHALEVLDGEEPPYSRNPGIRRL